MSFEKPNPQEVLVRYDNGSLEHVFSIQLTNGSSTKALDMPLLIDLPPNENELLLNSNVASEDDDFKNDQHATLNLQTGFIAANRVIKKEEELSTHEIDNQHPVINDSRQQNSSNESSIDCRSEDDVSLSEYLIFHANKGRDADLISTYGCYVNLRRLNESEIYKWTKPVMCEGEMAPKRPRLNSKTKHVQRRRESISNPRVSRSRSASIFQDTSNNYGFHDSVNKRPNATCEIIPKPTRYNCTNLPSATEVNQFGRKITSTSRISRRSTAIDSKRDIDGNGVAAHPTNQQWTEDVATGQMKIVLIFVRDKGSGNYKCYRIPERYGIKKCRVSIQRLAIQPAAPCNKKRRRECDQPMNLTLTKKRNFSVTRRVKEKRSNDFSNDVKTLTVPATNTNLHDSRIENLVQQRVDAHSSTSLLPEINDKHTSPTVNEIPNVATSRLNEKHLPTVEERHVAVDSHGSVDPNKPEENMDSLFDDIDALDFATTNFGDLQTLDRFIEEIVDASHPLVPETNDSHANPLTIITEDAPTCELNEKPLSSTEKTASPLLGKKMDENVTLTTEVVSKSETDDDDNCSVASEISLFASDSETIYSPDRKKPTAGWSLKTYHIPKTKPNETLDQQVQEILAVSMKKSPKMISPISNSIGSGSESKKKKFRNGRKLESSIIETKSAKPKRSITKTEMHRQASAVEPNGMADLGGGTSAPSENIVEETTRIDTTEAEKNTAEPNGTGDLGDPEQLELDPNKPNAPPENIVEATTIIDTTQPRNGMQYKSKIDFKNLERIAINVGHANSSRIVLKPNSVVTHSQSAVPAVPVPCTASVQSTAQRYEQPSNILLVPQPMDSVQNVVHKQSAVPAATAQLEPFAKQPLNTQPVAMEQPNNSIRGHSNAGQPDDLLKRKYFGTTMNIFEHPCINFLQTVPCAVPIDCPFSHQLPNCDTILRKMHNIPVDLIDFIYKKFIAQYRPTFERYFRMVCRLLGMRQMQETLIASVKDCDKYEKYDFYKFIFGGLLLCGNKDAEAIDKMVDIVDPRIENQMLALVEIMNNPVNPYS